MCLWCSDISRFLGGPFGGEAHTPVGQIKEGIRLYETRLVAGVYCKHAKKKAKLRIQELTVEMVSRRMEGP